jgi:hypothetical protein
VAAGSVNTDAVNVAQLKGAISLINGVADAAVTYDLDAGGNPNYRRVTLGAGTGTTTIGNLAGGAVTAGSLEAVNGGQLAATNAPSPASSAVARPSIRPAARSPHRCSRSAPSPPAAPSPRACMRTPPMLSPRSMARWSISTRRSPISATVAPSTCG